MTDQSAFWQAPDRPEWLAKILDECRYMDPAAIVPLDAENLIQTAIARTGLTDFGTDDWREPFEILTRSLDREAELHVFGRIMTRNELVNLLEARLRGALTVLGRDVPTRPALHAAFAARRGADPAGPAEEAMRRLLAAELPDDNNDSHDGNDRPGGRQ